ncbi:NADP-dependent oxidoreductase [Risungbinella massiliensis]|uniref:NADP-dependent oxidoreductase n=1 Tax=Risungbinella massiliensis TaxID=1329796 RepID=UPI0005CC1664|nr:NADP-dependent oxidoreductase [Risungbinella massiliensis]
MNNKAVYLIKRPQGMPTPDDFAIRNHELPPLQKGEVKVQTIYLSVDPYMRSRMSGRTDSYIPPFKLNEVLTAGVVGKVTESLDSNFHKGDLVLGMLGWQEFSIASAKHLTKLQLEEGIPLSNALSVVGMPGLTAYFGLLDIGKPQAGETVLVSGAAGAVGSIVGQIAKIQGCHVVGIAGSNEKVQYLINELNFDEAFNYKNVDLHEEIQRTCPNGVDIYFDNVGGEITDAVLNHLNKFARIPICGAISEYNLTGENVGPRAFSKLLTKSALAKGFLVGDYAKRTSEGTAALAKWASEGKIQSRENIIDGLDKAVEAFLGLFRGENIGKQLVRVAKED